MFGISVEKRVVRDADRIVSLKEDVDALSWSRVLEIGKLLRERASDDSQAEYGRELVTIAQSNLSLANRLGIDPAPPESRTMASGMEIVEGGYAEAAFESQVSSESPGSPVAAAQPPAADECEAARTRYLEPAVASPVDASECEKDGACDANAPQEDASENAADASDDPAVRLPDSAPGAYAPNVAAEEADRPRERTEERVRRLDLPSIELPARDEPDEPEPRPAAVESGAETGPAIAAESPSSDEPESVAGSACFAESDAPAGSKPACECEPAVGHELPVELPPVSASAEPEAGEPAPLSVGRSSAPEGADEGRGAACLSKEQVARFRNLYESRDGSLAVFEDDRGHLVAVDVTKLA